MENLCKIRTFLSFVLTYCDSDCIQEVIYQKLNIEKAQSRLELNEVDRHFDGSVQDSHFRLGNLQKFYFNNEKSLNDKTSLNSKDQYIKLLLRNLIDLRVHDVQSEESLAILMKLFNELAKTDATILFSYLLELDENELRFFQNVENFEFKSFLSYEFLLYLFALNIVDSGTNKNAHLFKPSVLSEYILGKQI